MVLKEEILLQSVWELCNTPPVIVITSAYPIPPYAIHDYRHAEEFLWVMFTKFIHGLVHLWALATATEITSVYTVLWPPVHHISTHVHVAYTIHCIIYT